MRMINSSPRRLSPLRRSFRSHICGNLKAPGPSDETTPDFSTTTPSSTPKNDFSSDSASLSQKPPTVAEPREDFDFDDLVDLTPEDSDDIDLEETEFCSGEVIYSPSLVDYVQRRSEGVFPPAASSPFEEWAAVWALAVSEQRGSELMRQYSRVGIRMDQNFTDFYPVDGCAEAVKDTTLHELTLMKARAVYEGTGLPCIAETLDMSIDAPESGSRINKSLQQGYYTRNVEEEGDAMIDRVRPISDENRMTRFNSVAVFYDGKHEISTSQTVSVALAFSSVGKASIASAGALDNLFKELSPVFKLSLSAPEHERSSANVNKNESKENVFVGATLLRDRIMREGKVLGDGIIKVSSFVNHMVDTDLMEVCGEELGERLRRTGPTKVLTVESTGLIIGMPTARRLGVPLVFARKSRPITISDSYQTTYRSATKGTTSELIVSCEYLESGDRVVVVDDFLAGGSTAEGLFKLAKMAHAKVVGVGVLIEKISEGGRTFLSGYDVPVESLAKVTTSGDRGGVMVKEEEPWVPPEAGLDGQQVRDQARRAQVAYYSRTEAGANDSRMDRERDGRTGDDMQDLNGDDRDGMLMNGGNGNGDDSEMDVIRWDDDETLDGIEEDLVRGGR